MLNFFHNFLTYDGVIGLPGGGAVTGGSPGKFPPQFGQSGTHSLFKINFNIFQQI
jgi:hypothetical protein